MQIFFCVFCSECFFLFSIPNTHSHCVLPNSKLQATCKQANSQGVNAKIHNESVCLLSDADCSRPKEVNSQN
jgi:hypothetical protein